MAEAAANAAAKVAKGAVDLVRIFYNNHIFTSIFHFLYLEQFFKKKKRKYFFMPKISSVL